ncbi:MAG: sigma-70 family RNA polymerase sigma factor [Saprospiraceae bacterium]|nr:sigma-70 family RNA polymerase sigma factor [Saprospiraceae bacterium]
MDAHKIVAHQFRHSYGAMVAALSKRFGIHHLHDIEDVVQESLFKAMKIWPFKGVPVHPQAWLIRTAGNALIDKLRADQRKRNIPSTNQHDSFEPTDPATNETIEDDQLQMIFMCCHPDLSERNQIILTLKLVAGFGNLEIAAALLQKADAVAKAYTRAKKKIRDQAVKLVTPIEIGLSSRLPIVLKIIYLIFSEGYRTHFGKAPIQKDLCYEAIRLALLLDRNKYCSKPNTHALLAMMSFHASRFETRVDEDGCIIDLEQQDRSIWDQELISIGRRYLSKSTDASNEPTDYLFQAIISYHHCKAKTYVDTAWDKILALYDMELTRRYTPIIALNRIVPLMMAHGFEIGLDALQTYKNQARGPINTLYYAIKARLLEMSRNIDGAIDAYKDAIKISDNEAETKYLIKRKEALLE